jgi:hypothetical protein
MLRREKGPGHLRVEIPGFKAQVSKPFYSRRGGDDAQVFLSNIECAFTT